MLVITQSKLNKLSVTLTEKKQSSTKIYLIEFVNKQSEQKYYTVATDVSPTPNRYNQFCVYENSYLSGSTNPLNSQIILPFGGFYFYNIFENPNSLLLPSGLNQVETGYALILQSKVENVPTYNAQVTKTEIIYNRENYLK